MRIGYVRSLFSDKEVEEAVDALEKAGCDRVLVDSGARARPEQRGALSGFLVRMQPGDDLVVLRLDHLANTTSRLLDFIAALSERGIRVETAAGDFSTQDEKTARVLKKLWDLEQHTRELRQRNEIRPNEHRMMSQVGRPRVLAEDDIAAAREAVEHSSRPIAQIAREFGVSRATLYRSLKRN